MKVDYVHKDTLTATDYVELNKNNELLVSYNQALLKEIQELKKQLKHDYYVKGLEGTIKEYQQEMNKVAIQQKEFINYLEEEIKIYSKTTYAEEILKELEEILQKCKKHNRS
jgi:hypothetical protein